jgi:transcriptional regulator with XRE-family HTH domain
MPARNSTRTATGRRTRKVIANALADLDRLRVDSGVSLRRLAQAAEVDPGYLTQVLAGKRQPSVAVLVALSSALGADLAIRAYPTTGPAIRDRFQAAIVEELVRIAAATWRRSVEVSVTRPARGFIDLVFDRSWPVEVVATEVHTRLNRLEQTIRWSQDKAGSLPSADLWAAIEGDPVVHRLLVLRSTAATRDVARRFEATLRTQYPARTTGVYKALTTLDSPWPGNGILWADVRGDVVRILDRPPRGVLLGR